MAIGSLGGIVFQVSDSAVLTFKGMTREVSGRWVEHEVMGVKPKKEFLGAGNQKINLPITLSAALGVKPRKMLEGKKSRYKAAADAMGCSLNRFMEQAMDKLAAEVLGEEMAEE